MNPHVHILPTLFFDGCHLPAPRMDWRVEIADIKLRN